MICALLLFKFILVDISPPTNGTEISLLPSKEMPFILIGTDVKKVREGALCDLAPTMLQLLGEEIPPEMTGRSLIIDD